MARTKGTFTLGANIELEADAPLDARLSVAQKSDLTAAGSFPYKYVGMIVTVAAEQKAYMLTGSDTTTLSNWKDMGDVDQNHFLFVDELPETGEVGYLYFVPVEGATGDNKFDEYTWNDDDEEWEKIGSASVDASPTAKYDYTTTVEVGGIPSGSSISEDDLLADIVKNMLCKVYYPSFTAPSATLAATGAKLLEVGDTLSTTMTITFNRGAINPAYGTSGYRAGAASDYTLDGTTQASNSFAITVTSAKTSYQGSVSYAAGEQPKDSTGANYDDPLAAGSVNTNTITYEFVNALWANTSDITTVAKQSLVSKSAKVKEFNFPAQTIANPEIFDVPASWTVTAVEVLNTLSNQWENCASEFTITDTTHNDAGGASTNYKRYTDNRGYNAGARKVRVKWS